jgi:hypothetical protein
MEIDFVPGKAKKPAEVVCTQAQNITKRQEDQVPCDPIIGSEIKMKMEFALTSVPPHIEA